MAKECVLGIDEICRIVTPIFDSYDVDRAWLFGSYARGDSGAESDIDLLIEGGQIKGMFGLGRMYDDLTKALNKPVDLVTLEALNHEVNASQMKRLKMNIIKDERLIYENKRY